MKGILAAAAGIGLLAGSPNAAPNRSTVEHFTRPVVNGQKLPFSDAVRVGDILYLSGQIGMAADGKLPEGIEAQTRQAMDNVGSVLTRVGIGTERIFHCTAFLADMKDWPAFNKVYVTYFPNGEMPARSAFGVNGLALGARLEIECQAYAGTK